LKETRFLIEREIDALEMLSLRQFCRGAGLSVSLITSQSPDLKRCYEQQYGRFIARQRSQRNETFQQEVKKAVAMLLERGDYPSVGSVILLKPTLSHAGWDLIQRAIQAALESTIKPRL
jgi:hypothetical protein